MGVQSLSLSVLCHLPGCILTNFSFLPCCLWSSTEDVGRGAVRVQLFSEVMNLRRAVLVAVALLCPCPCLRCVIAVILDTRLLGLLFLFLAKKKTCRRVWAQEQQRGAPTAMGAGYWGASRRQQHSLPILWPLGAGRGCEGTSQEGKYLTSLWPLKEDNNKLVFKRNLRNILIGSRM